MRTDASHDFAGDAVMFRIHDFDGDGVISPQDLAAYLLRVAPRAQAGAQQPPEGEAGGAGTGGAPGDDEEAGKVPDAPGAGVEVKADDDEQGAHCRARWGW